MDTRIEEHYQKLDRLRSRLPAQQTLRLRGIDWFAWLFAGAASGVLLAAEKGIAEVFVSADELVVLTDEIEALRLKEEELPDTVQIKIFPWAYPEQREAWVAQRVGPTRPSSDHPVAAELPLSPEIESLKRELSAPELQRYQEIGHLAACAMTEAMLAAKPDWSEFDLAAAGASALLSRGLQPALILASGERRLPLYRHPLPTNERLGNMAMLVFCARGLGLYANLTRFISFGPLPAKFVDAHHKVRQVEAEALSSCRPGTSLAELYAVLENAYRNVGNLQAIAEHHQGGITGYQAREVIARPDSVVQIVEGSALALNPSVTGAKIEDTFYVTHDGLRNLTFDATWPHSLIDGRHRPDVLQH